MTKCHINFLIGQDLHVQGNFSSRTELCDWRYAILNGVQYGTEGNQPVDRKKKVFLWKSRHEFYSD